MSSLLVVGTALSITSARAEDMVLIKADFSMLQSAGPGGTVLFALDVQLLPNQEITVRAEAGEYFRTIRPGTYPVGLVEFGAVDERHVLIVLAPDPEERFIRITLLAELEATAEPGQSVRQSVQVSRMGVLTKGEPEGELSQERSTFATVAPVVRMTHAH